MNSVILVGRLTKDVEYRVGEKTSVAKFTVAVDNPFNKDKSADFIDCVAFGKTADFMDKYFSKGKGISLSGRIETGSYETDNGKRYFTRVAVNNVEFVPDSKSDKQKQAEEQISGFSALDEDIPF